MLVEDVLPGYPAAATVGTVPGEVELIARHPELAAHIVAFFFLMYAASNPDTSDRTRPPDTASGVRPVTPVLDMTPVTQHLEAACRGEPHAAAELLPLVYAELRKLAAVKLAHEKPGQTLDATALVHEAYLKLVGDQQFDGRRSNAAAGRSENRSNRIRSRHRRRMTNCWR
jgi:hypothetical protein